MKKTTKTLLLILGFVLVAVLSVAGTLAYLQHEDSDINVMTMGNVKIKQNEYERVVENGVYETKEIDNKTSYVLKEFTQDKPLLPIVGDPHLGQAGWDTITVRMSQVNSYGGMDVFAGKNAQDKFVTVTNTGRTDAYVRTIVAIEVGTADSELLGTSYHNTWNKNEIGVVSINGNNYSLTEYLYQGGELSDGSWRHENGVLPAGKTSYPSLAQVYLSSKATNEDCEDLDGNGNGKLDILVLSQAVQANGFDNAQTALDTAFGKTSEKAAEWFGSKESGKMVETADELKAALAEGGKVILGEDIAIDSDAEGAAITIPTGKEVALDLNGHTISGTFTKNKATSLIENKGNLTISNGKLVYEGVGDPSFGYGTNTINNSGSLTVNGATIVNNTNSGSSNAIDNAPGSKLVVNSGRITAKKIAIRVRDASDVTINAGKVTGSRALQIQLFQNVNDNTKVTINGGTLTGTSGLAFYSVANGSCTFAKTTINITDGTFNGGVAFGGGNKTAQETVSITGGTFSDYLGRYLANDGWEDIAKP